jgi:hypothetical protein
MIAILAIVLAVAIFAKWEKHGPETRLVGKLWLLPSRLLCVIEIHSSPIYQKLESGNRTFKLIGTEIETEKDKSDIFLVKFFFIYVMISFGWIRY